jgi:methylase of polypeptide subunit release factors
MYTPREDSYLMCRILKEKIPEFLKINLDLKFLEIGTGSGIHLETAFNMGIKKQNIFSCDIDMASVEHCNLLGFNCINSDLFEQLKGGETIRGTLVPHEFDLIIFNPPYLPQDLEEPEDSQRETTGGKKGNEIILRFLKQAKSHLNKNGKIFLITSSLSENINFKKLDYKFKEIGCEKLFFETLCIWELTQ